MGTGEPQRARRTQRSEDITGNAMGVVGGQQGARRRTRTGGDACATKGMGRD